MQNKLKTQKTRYMSPKLKGLNARYVMVHPKKLNKNKDNKNNWSIHQRELLHLKVRPQQGQPPRLHCSRGDWTQGMWVFIRFISHVLQLLPMEFTQGNLCSISKYAMKPPPPKKENQIEKLDSPSFRYGYQKCMSVYILYIKYTQVPPSCVHC